MARIRHIALTTKEPAKVAEFYKEAFGLKELRRSPNGAVFLTDGHINLAILNHKDERSLDMGAHGPNFSGIHHFGFEVEDLDEACDTARTGARAAADRRRTAIDAAMAGGGHANFEMKWSGPRRRRDRHLAYRLGRHARGGLTAQKKKIAVPAKAGIHWQAMERLNRGSGFRRDCGTLMGGTSWQAITRSASARSAAGCGCSPDGGDSWQRVRDGLHGESRVYGLAGAPEPSRAPMFAGAEDGIYKSRDGGQSFTRLDSPMNACEVWKIAIDPTDPDIIFAGTRPAALYRSTDGGQNWRKLPADIVEECPNVGVPRVTALTVDPSDHRVVWAGIEVDGVRRSTDGGESWSRITNGVYDLDIHDIAVTVNGGDNSADQHAAARSSPAAIGGESWRGLGVRDQFALPLLPRPGAKGRRSGDAVRRDRRRRGRQHRRDPALARRRPELGDADAAGRAELADLGLRDASRRPRADPRLQPLRRGLSRATNAGDSWRKLRREFTEIRALCWVPD